MHRTYPYIAAVLVTLLLASVARFYHRDTGFTALIGFAAGRQRASPTLQSIPHDTYPPAQSYDGQFYAQRAFDPLIRDPEIDRVTDSAPFRARRILFSWTAYVLGLGYPPWILQAYALQNVVCWLLLAALLTRWIPPTSGRGLALWAACLFSHGMMWSVRFSLLDGPSLLLIACAVAAVEAGRPLLSAAIVGVAGLARETNVLAVVAQPLPVNRREGLRLAAALAAAALPVVIWYDYLWSIYRSTLVPAHASFAPLGAGLSTIWSGLLPALGRTGPLSEAGSAAALLLSLAAQAVRVFLRREYGSPWWRIAVVYAVMMLFLHPGLVEPRTGAITRVLLPMTVGFNVLLAREPRAARFWPWFVVGNLHMLPALRVMPLLPW